MFPGGELLPAAPLQPCAGAPSGRGHLFSGWVNLAPCNFSSNNVLLAVQAWGTPLAWRHVPRPPIRWVSSGRWVLSEPCQYIPCPLLPTISSRVFSARHNIKHMYTLLNYNSLETVERANYLNVLTNCRIHVLSQFFSLECDDLFA